MDLSMLKTLKKEKTNKIMYGISESVPYNPA